MQDVVPFDAGLDGVALFPQTSSCSRKWFYWCHCTIYMSPCLPTSVVSNGTLSAFQGFPATSGMKGCNEISCTKAWWAFLWADSCLLCPVFKHIRFPKGFDLYLLMKPLGFPPSFHHRVPSCPSGVQKRGVALFQSVLICLNLILWFRICKNMLWAWQPLSHDLCANFHEEI